MKDELDKADESTDIVLIQADQLPKILTEGGIETLVSQIEERVRSEVFDIETKEGRKGAKSLARRVSSSKTAIDRARLDLTKGWRNKIDAVNAEGKIATERLDALRDEVREPVAKWEALEEARLEGHQSRIREISEAQTDWQMPSAEIQAVIDRIAGTVIDDSWEEFEEVAEEAKQAALARHRATLETATAREEQEAELSRLRAENEAREKAEAEERERREQEAEQARKKAEEEERAEKRRQERVDALLSKIETQKSRADDLLDIAILELRENTPIPDDLGSDRDRVELAKMKAEQALDARIKEREAKRAEEAEAERVRREAEAEEQRKRDIEAAEERARKEAEEKAAEERRQREAAEAEKLRKEAEEKRKAEKRANDRRHREKIRGEIIEAFKGMAGRATPESIANALMAGEIPHVEVKL